MINYGFSRQLRIILARVVQVRLAAQGQQTFGLAAEHNLVVLALMLITCRHVSSSSLCCSRKLQRWRGFCIRLATLGLLLAAERLREADTQVVRLLDEALVSLDFVDEHLHELLVLRELGVDLVHVGLEAGNLGAVDLSFFGVPLLDRVDILGAVALMVVQVAAVAGSVALGEAGGKVRSIGTL